MPISDIMTGQLCPFSQCCLSVITLCHHSFFFQGAVTSHRENMKKGYDRNLGKVQLGLTLHVTVELQMLRLKTATAAVINEKFRGFCLDFFIDVEKPSP